MKRTALGLAAAVILVGGTLASGQGQSDHPFRGQSDNGETLHILPPQAALHSPHATLSTFAPVLGRTVVYPASYGSGNLVNHGGHQIPNAGFFAVYWNGAVANAGGSGVTSLGYVNLQAQIGAFVTQFSDSLNYSASDVGADYSIIQQYGTTDAISPAGLSMGYYIDSQASQSSYSD